MARTDWIKPKARFVEKDVDQARTIVSVERETAGQVDHRVPATPDLPPDLVPLVQHRARSDVRGALARWLRHHLSSASRYRSLRRRFAHRAPISSSAAKALERHPSSWS